MRKGDPLLGNRGWWGEPLYNTKRNFSLLVRKETISQLWYHLQAQLHWTWILNVLRHLQPRPQIRGLQVVEIRPYLPEEPAAFARLAQLDLPAVPWQLPLLSGVSIGVVAANKLEIPTRLPIQG